MSDHDSEAFWTVYVLYAVVASLVLVLTGCATPPRPLTCAESRALICMNTNKPAPPLYGCKPTPARPIVENGTCL